jgi:hypothetical protein
MLCLYGVLTCVGRGLYDGLITRPEESYRVSVCVWSRNPERKAKGPSWTISACEWMNECGVCYQNSLETTSLGKQHQRIRLRCFIRTGLFDSSVFLCLEVLKWKVSYMWLQAVPWFSACSIGLYENRLPYPFLVYWVSCRKRSSVRNAGLCDDIWIRTSWRTPIEAGNQWQYTGNGLSSLDDS